MASSGKEKRQAAAAAARCFSVTQQADAATAAASHLCAVVCACKSETTGWRPPEAAEMRTRRRPKLEEPNRHNTPQVALQDSNSHAPQNARIRRDLDAIISPQPRAHAHFT